LAASASIYANCFPLAFSGHIDLLSDTLMMALLGSGYTPDLTSDTHWSDISSNEITGTGYTAGGVALTSVSSVVTAANSWGVTWAADTPYSYGQIVRPDTGNGYVYRCAVAGTSNGSEPSFPTVTSETVTDSGVTWSCLGDAVWVFSSAAPYWSGATFSADYAVIYDAQTGTPSSEPLIVLETFASTQSPSAEVFQVLPDSVLGWFAVSPPS
jgi:hypothetical protein